MPDNLKNRNVSVRSIYILSGIFLVMIIWSGHFLAAVPWALLFGVGIASAPDKWHFATRVLTIAILVFGASVIAIGVKGSFPPEKFEGRHAFHFFMEFGFPGVAAFTIILITLLVPWRGAAILFGIVPSVILVDYGFHRLDVLARFEEEGGTIIADPGFSISMFGCVIGFWVLMSMRLFLQGRQSQSQLTPCREMEG